MYKKRQLFLLIALLAMTLSCCKDDDDKPGDENENFSEYFTCKINGVEFKTRSDWGCDGKSFYYYPAGTSGLEEGYMLITGKNCNDNVRVAIRIFNPNVPALGSFNFLTPVFADSISPFVSYFTDDVYAFENLSDGFMTINTFTPRDSITHEFGKIEGTFEFTVTNDTQDSTVYVTDGAFRFKVPNFW